MQNGTAVVWLILFFHFFCLSLAHQCDLPLSSGIIIRQRSFTAIYLKEPAQYFLLGIMLNAFPFIRQDWDWSEFRYLGVLQRIALSYGLSALLIIKFDFKQLVQILASLLLFYWAILWIGGGEFPYSLEDNLVRKIDLIVLGKDHLYGGFGVRFDPEGILSTIPSIGSVIIGYLMGGMLHTTKNYNDCAKRMFIFGCITSMVGYVGGSRFQSINPCGLVHMSSSQVG